VSHPVEGRCQPRNFVTTVLTRPGAKITRTNFHGSFLEAAKPSPNRSEDDERRKGRGTSDQTRSD
jgi:hypothetical protein